MGGIQELGGRSADAAGLSSLRDEAAKASSPEAFIPSACWAIVENFGFDLAQVYSVTAKTIEAKVGPGRRLGRVSRRKVVAWSQDRAVMEKMITRLVSAKAEQRRREMAARQWFEKEKARITASGMQLREDAPAAEAEGLQPDGDSRDAQGGSND